MLKYFISCAYTHVEKILKQLRLHFRYVETFLGNDTEVDMCCRTVLQKHNLNLAGMAVQDCAISGDQIV